MKSICIIGTGGFAKEVLSLINDLGMYDEVEAFMEPDHLWEEKGKDRIIMGKKVLPMSLADPDKHKITIGVASILIRQKTLTQLPADGLNNFFNLLIRQISGRGYTYAAAVNVI